MPVKHSLIINRLRLLFNVIYRKCEDTTYYECCSDDYYDENYDDFDDENCSTDWFQLGRDFIISLYTQAGFKIDSSSLLWISYQPVVNRTTSTKSQFEFISKILDLFLTVDGYNALMEGVDIENEFSSENITSPYWNPVTELSFANDQHNDLEF